MPATFALLAALSFQAATESDTWTELLSRADMALARFDSKRALEALDEVDRLRPGLATAAYYRARARALEMADEDVVLDALFEVSQRGGYDARIARTDDLLYVVREARRDEFNGIVDEWQASTELGRALSPPVDAVLTTRQPLSVPGDGGHLVALQSNRAFTVVDVATGEVQGGLASDAEAGHWVLERTGRWAARLSEAGVLEAWRFGPFEMPERVAVLPLFGRIDGDERAPSLEGESRDLGWFEPGRSIAVRTGDELHIVLLDGTVEQSLSVQGLRLYFDVDTGEAGYGIAAWAPLQWPRDQGRVPNEGWVLRPGEAHASELRRLYCGGAQKKFDHPSPGRDRVAFMGDESLAVIGFSPEAKSWTATPVFDPFSGTPRGPKSAAWSLFGGHLAVTASGGGLAIWSESGQRLLKLADGQLWGFSADSWRSELEFECAGIQVEIDLLRAQNSLNKGRLDAPDSPDWDGVAYQRSPAVSLRTQPMSALYPRSQFDEAYLRVGDRPWHLGPDQNDGMHVVDDEALIRLTLLSLPGGGVVCAVPDGRVSGHDPSDIRWSTAEGKTLERLGDSPALLERVYDPLAVRLALERDVEAPEDKARRDMLNRMSPKRPR